MRDFLINEPFRIAEQLNFILSLNIVGSFSECDDLSGVSDIDTVIIVDHLDQKKFNEIMFKFDELSVDLNKRFGFKLFSKNKGIGFPIIFEPESKSILVGSTKASLDFENLYKTENIEKFIDHSKQLKN